MFDSPIIEFVNSYERIGYGDVETDALKDKIKLTKTKEAPGEKKYCHMGDLAKVHWKTTNLESGEIIYDSKKVKRGNAREFIIGHYEVSKCWDVAIMQMKNGETADIICPAEVDTGRGLNITAYDMDGGETSDPVHERTSGKTDVKYEFEVKECGGSKQAPRPAREVKDGQCFNILSSFIKQDD